MYYLALKSHNIRIQATTQINLRNIMLSTRSQIQKGYILFYSSEMSRIGKSIQTENSLVFTLGWEIWEEMGYDG